MYSFCTFLLQLAPSVISVALYLRLDQKVQVHQDKLDKRVNVFFMENMEKQKVLNDEIVLKYDKRTTLLKDKLALLEKEVEYLDEVDHRMRTLITVSVVMGGSLCSVLWMSR
jgi:hypothetical protein